MVKQANKSDIPVIENILAKVVSWMDNEGLHQWEKDNVKWDHLSKYYSVDDFYLAYTNDIPVACMALIDYDPAFWPNIPKGVSLYLHKVAVLRDYAGMGFSKELIDFAKEKAKQLGIQTLRLDCHKGREKVRSVYEKQGFFCIEEKTLFDKYETAFYVYDLNND